MIDNPPEPRNHEVPSETWHQSAARIGFLLSLIGVIGLTLVGWIGPVMTGIGMWMTFLCLPGLVASSLGLIRPPRRLAKWGVFLGILGSLYLPTFCLSLFVKPYL